VLFADPDAPSRIRSELAAELAAHGFASADNAIGAAHDPARQTLDRVSRVGPRKDLHFHANMSG
jgi:hypothetical protein